MSTTDVPQEFQEMLRPHLPFADEGTLEGAADLTALGLDSMAVVALLADIEDRYDVELPDEIVVESTFATVGSLWTTLEPLVASGGEQ